MKLEDVKDLESIVCPRDKRSVTLSSKRRDGIQYRVFDDGRRGFYLRYTTPDGRRNTTLLTRSGTIEEARELRDQYMSELLQGVDPVDAKRRRREQDISEQLRVGALSTDARHRLVSLSAEWLEHLKATGRAEGTIDDYRHTLSKYVLPIWGGRDVRGLRYLELERLIASQPTKGRGRNILKTLRAFFSYCLQVRSISQNPLLGMKDLVQRTKSAPGHHVLSGAEAHKFLNELETLSIDSDLKMILHLELATALRVGEVCALRWSDIDTRKGVIVHPSSIMKNGDPAQTAISRYVAELLVSHREAKASASDRLFDDRWVTSSVVNAVRTQLRSWIVFKTHSLRRTASTRLQALGCPEEVRRKIQNQKSQSTLSSIYDHDPQINLQLQWLECWADDLRGIKSNPDHWTPDGTVDHERAALLARLGS